jgi:MFS family permease
MRQRALLFVLAGNMLIDALEVSVLLVALPAIGGDLGQAPRHAQWVMSGFAFGFAAMLPLGARLTARWGHRSVYLLALATFIAASVVGGAADSAGLLVLTRVVKGMCAALTAPTGLSIIGTTFREGAEQRRAIATYSLFGAAGFTVGLLSSGALTGVSWRWDLIVPAPAALLLLVVGHRLIPADRGVPRPEVPRSRRMAPSLLRNGAFIRCALCAAMLNGTYLGLLLLLTYRLHQTHGWGPWGMAVAFLPACLPLVLTLPFSGRLIARFGTDRLVATGMTTAVLGHAAYALRGAPEPYATGVLPTLLLVEAGFVLSFAALNTKAVSDVPPAERRRAVPLYQTAVQLGAVVLLPSVGALLPTAQDTHAYRNAALLITAAGGVGLLSALAGMSRRSRRG